MTQKQLINRTFYIIFLLIFPSVGCSDTKVKPVTPQETKSPWDGFSQFLAGMESVDSGKYSMTVGVDQFQIHKKFMDKSWLMLKENTVDKMGSWQEKNIPQSHRNRTVFYPLSGADFINVYSLFPASRKYILVGLEESGDPGLMNELLPDAKSLRLSLSEIRNLMSYYSRYSYFTSKGMSEHMHGHRLHGVLPVFLISLARLGMEIKSVEGVTVDVNGNLNSHDGVNPQALHISFFSPRENEIKELIYFNLAISNESLSSASPLGKYLEKDANFNLMLKSAVYLFHNPRYDAAGKYLLSRTDFILQDDSGFPYRKLEGNIWDIQLFGKFTAPVKLSGIVPENPVQPDLAEAYRKSALPLPFEYGYGNLRGRGNSNLLTARKK